jgi:hypothetical protein
LWWLFYNVYTDHNHDHFYDLGPPMMIFFISTIYIHASLDMKPCVTKMMSYLRLKIPEILNMLILKVLHTDCHSLRIDIVPHAEQQELLSIWLYHRFWVVCFPHFYVSILVTFFIFCLSFSLRVFCSFSSYHFLVFGSRLGKKWSYGFDS